MRGNGYWKKRLALEDDETVREIEEAVLERGVDIEDEDDDSKTGIIHIGDYAEKVEESYKDWNKPKGLMTGFPSLDKKTGGLGDGHVILIGGETSNGKSALAQNIAVRCGARGDRTLYISLEMTQSEVFDRFRHIHNKSVADLNIQVQETHDVEYQHINGIIKAAKEWPDWGDLKLVVLDYMQYLGRGMTNQEVAKMSKMFKKLALEHNIPFMVIVSLRKSEGGKSKRKWTDIEIEDFMGTGAIGYDCDTAMIVSRKNLNDEYDEERMFLKVLKTRNARLDYNKRYLSFAWDATRITEDEWTTKDAVDKDGMIEA